jgi:hypothetical protein
VCSYIQVVRIVGIAVNMVTPKRPALRLCILDDAAGNPAVTHAEEISADDVDVVEQLFTVARGVESRLKGLDVDRVIVRRADVPTVASKKDAPRIRLLTEGAAVGASRAAIPDTRLAMGVELAHWYGQAKNDLDAAAVARVAAAGKHSKYGEAAAAALAGFRAP